MFGALLLLVLGVSSRPVTSSALDAPRNVRLTSVNMNLQLEWDPPEGGARDLLYSTQFWARMSPAQVTAGCVNTTRRRCDLSAVARPVSEFGAYVGSVRAQRGAQTSSWTHSNSLTLFRDTVIGPPGLALLSRGSSLEVVITDPEFSVSSLRSTFPDATYNLSYWREGEQQVQRIPDAQQNRLVLNELQPWSRYCAEVHIRTELAGASRPSGTVCESTSSSEEAAPWLAAAVTAAVLALLVALLVIGVRHRQSISYFLCPQEVMPEHWKQYLLAPPSSLLTQQAPPTEDYHPLSVLPEQPAEAQRPLDSPCSDATVDGTVWPC
ncbi:interleukin-10 receptor subunit beta-like [Synchiropus splendidus]|uniref:interleukin-10 receptor subunit beta-like n=1 Tax=Synchiropus splendidus TaxID=270530 RepID=UPI00237DF014|nr:interleukin-10 receptor subunit beta-like [Synchiropus splendidus]